MPIVESQFAPLRDPRLVAQLADHATSQAPAWLWSTDGSQILWANPVGAAIFNGATRGFGPGEPAASQVVRLAATLPSTGHVRLERLRGFGAGFGSALTCACSLVVLADGTPAVMIVATEPAGVPLTLQERVRRLFPDRERTLAAFTPDGALVDATATARTRLGGASTLSDLGVDALAAQALASGNARGTTSYGPVTMERLGSAGSTVLMIAFDVPANESPSAMTQPGEAAAAAAEPQAASLTETAAAASPALAEAAPESQVPSRPPARDEAQHERRHPLRFVWQMDVEGRFAIGSDEFVELVGPRTMAAFGRQWSEVATELKLDPDNQILRAAATRETWSGIVISWPVDEIGEPLSVELSGLPVFDRDRNFRGYRGFGVCRDIKRINQLMRMRRERPIGFMPRPQSPEAESPVVVASHTVASGAAPAAADTAPDLEQMGRTMVPAASSPAATDIAARAESHSLRTAANVVPFRSGAASEPKTPSLSVVERKAFRELAQELTARLRGERDDAAANDAAERTSENSQQSSEPDAAARDREPPPDHDRRVAADVGAAPAESGETTAASATLALQLLHDESTQRQESLVLALLNGIPAGVLVYRDSALLYANRRFLDWTGHENLEALAASGGLTTVLAELGAGALPEDGGPQRLPIVTRGADRFPLEGRLVALPWREGSARALILTSGEAEERRRSTTLALGAAENEIRDLKTMLDAAAEGILLLDRDGKVITATRSAEALFERAANELPGRSLSELFAPESEPRAREYFDRFLQNTDAVLKDTPADVLEVMARARGGERIPVTMTLTRVGADRFCAVLRDAAALGRIEEEMRAARQEALRTAAAKTDFVAKVSHEIRTPLNAITGFAEVIMAERFGPIGNERYREYLRDIHAAAIHLVSLLNDLLDLTKVEAGQLELNFASVCLNELTQQCVGIMQPQANRARIIIRTSLTPGLPRVMADERSLRQIVLNLLSNSIRFTGPGGQVIVSTALSDDGEALLRVRDTGVGMSAADIEAALQPFRQTATSASWGSGGTGLGLPLTKALAEANRAHFSITSAPNAGTLIEIGFPPARIVAG